MTFYLTILTLLTLIAVFGSTQKPSTLNPIIDIRRNKIFFCFGVISIYLLMILKEPITGDYGRYATHFMTIMFKSLRGETVLVSEPGYFVFNQVIRKFTGNPLHFFAITSGIICYSLGRFIYKFADNKRYAIFFYYTIGLFAFSMAGVRQTLAMSICLFSYTAIKKRKFFIFILIIGLAFLFHKSALFFIPAYFIAQIKWKFQNIAVILIGFALVSLYFNSIYGYITSALDYNYGIESTGNGGIFLIILLIISALALIYRKKLIEANSNNYIFINLHFVVLALWVFRMFTRTVERPAFYYLYASIILLDKILSLKLEKDEDIMTRRILVLSSLLLFALFFIYRLTRDGNLLPYVLVGR